MAKMIHNLSAMRNLARRLSADRRGVSALITAFALTALMGFAGLAVDVIMWEVNLRSMQGAADQSALGAAKAFRDANESTALGTSTTAINAAYATATQNGYPASSVTVAAYNNGSTCTNSGCIKVTITQAQRRYFTAIFSNRPVNESASAIGTCKGCGNGAFNVTSNGGTPCVMALDAGGTGVKTVTVSGTPTLSLNHCDLYNNSPNTDATVVNGAGIIEGCSPTSPCDSQAYLAQPNVPSGQIDIPVNTHSSPGQDPYAGLSPPTVSSPCTHISSLASLTNVPSGTYCGGSEFQNTAITFATGAVIVITGGLDLHSGSTSMTGTCVTLYVTSNGSSSQASKLNATTTMNITAPAQGIGCPGNNPGPYAGIAAWFSGTSAVTWNGANGTAFQGAIYAPSTDVTYSGNAVSASTCTRLIAASVSLGGTGAATFDNSGCPALAGPTMTASGISGSTPFTGSPMLIQ